MGTLRVLPSMEARSTFSLGREKWQVVNRVVKNGTESQTECATVLHGHSLEIEWCETDAQRIPSVLKHHHLRVVSSVNLTSKSVK